MAIILPEGTVDAWQAAHAAGTGRAWSRIDEDLLRQAADERDPTLRGDILTLADLAWSRAMDAYASAITLAGA